MLAEDVVVEDDQGQVSVRGRDELRQRFRAFFSAAPTVNPTVGSRIRVGSFVIDEEHVTGHPAGNVHAAAIYRLAPTG